MRYWCLYGLSLVLFSLLSLQQLHNKALQETINTQQQQIMDLTGAATLQQERIDNLISQVGIHLEMYYK